MHNISDLAHEIQFIFGKFGWTHKVKFGELSNLKLKRKKEGKKINQSISEVGT